MVVEGNKIIIHVSDVYQYPARFSGFGKETDSPSMHTAWGWVNHLREKIWWNQDSEREFLRLASIITEV